MFRLFRPIFKSILFIVLFCYVYIGIISMKEFKEAEKDITTISSEVETATLTTPTSTNSSAIETDYYMQLNSYCESTNLSSISLNSVPYFLSENITLGTESFESYSELDSLGRCSVAFACVGKDIMPTEERGNIGSIKPSGWHTVKYNGIVDGNYLYNRCHLIAYCLTGENANEKNLITGTRYMNVEGMLPYESKVANYLDNNSDNHVYYRTTPIFEGDNLVASGVVIEAYSVEDNGAGICFCVYCPNIQPNITINYSNGESSAN